MGIDMKSDLLEFARAIAPELTGPRPAVGFGKDNSSCWLDGNDPEFSIVVVIARNKAHVKAIYGAANAILGIEGQ